MATLEELYRYYLNQPITYVPGSTIGGLSSLTEINRNDSGGDSSESSNTVSVNSTPGKGITSISYSDMAKALGFAMNPALGIANMVATEAFGKSPMSMAMDALGFGSDSTSTGTANATDTGDMGSEAANDAASASAAAGGSGADGGGPGGGDSGDSGGPFRDGGRVGLYDGGSAFDNYNTPEYISSEDKNLSDYFNANVNYSTGESNPVNDVNVGTTNLQAIMNANIPINDKFSLLGRLGYFKDRASVTYKDYPKEIYEGSSKDRALGLGYYNNGLSASGMYNVDTKSPELRLDYTTKFANGGRIGYAEGGTTTYLTPTEFFETSDTRKEWAKILDELDEIVYSGQYANPEKAEYIKNLEDKKNKLYAQSWDEYYKSEADAALKQQTTPTEDFSDYLNTTTINTNVQTAPTVAEQMMSPEDALTPEVPQENPIQKHLDFNEFLKGQGLSQQDYNVLGGYDVAQNLAPGNPILGGAINLASPFYNLMQTFDSAKDTQGNIIKQYVPDMYEDATESGAYYTVPAQKFSDIPGSAARNIQGGLGILTNTQKQQYQDLRNQYETQRQKSAFERFTGAAGPLAENINTAISSLNPFQKQQYMNYAVQNPEQAIAAAQQNKDFLAATQKNIAPATTPAPASMAAGGRVFYLQGGLASLLR
jgi:hypothetical protein